MIGDKISASIILHQLYRELGENPPYILIHYRQSARAVSGKIKGLEPDNYSGISSSLSNVSIQ
ncbi:hypothetical protein ACQKF6_19060, partial [Bacillus velezensis]